MSLSQVVKATVGDTRTEADYLSHVQQLIATDPMLSMALGDGLLKHPSVRIVFDLCAIPLVWRLIWASRVNPAFSRSMQTRSDLLRDSSHKIVFHPPQALFLAHQVEMVQYLV